MIKVRSDLEAMQASGIESNDTLGDSGPDDILSPQQLADRAARCRVIVTGSYHAAVFGLAAGVPAVCITNSTYYDLKFRGLSAQFPGGCHIVRPGPRFKHELTKAIDLAWNTGESDRDKLHSAAQAQVAQGEWAYEQFRSLVAATAKRG